MTFDFPIIEKKEWIHCTAVPLAARVMGRELLAETVTRKDADASPMGGFTASI
jgi:hypothetical protein